MARRKQVLVTTEHRGVFFGKLVENGGDTVVLADARNCLYWSAQVKGFLGLAASGPNKGCRIGPKVLRLTRNGVTSITDCTKEAVEAWEAAPWK